MSKNKKNKTYIGGQAIIEGVMMCGKKSMAIAVRDEDGYIRLETKRIKRNNGKLAGIPIIRGIVNFIYTMAMGINTLMRSAEVFGESEPSKFEKWVAKKFKINIMTVITTISLILGIGLAIVLFIFLPTMLARLIFDIFAVIEADNKLLYGIVVGVFKILILIGYLILVSLLKDIKRTFMYHGAEHKTINCYESGKQLTVENVQSHSTLHNRCGTTFLFYVIFLSIIVFIVLQLFMPGITDSYFLEVGIRILAVPLIAGLAYEMLKFLAKYDLKIFLPLKLPGLALQKISTRQPDDKMVEVAITAFNAVLKMEEDDSAPEVNFIMPKKREEVYSEIMDMFEKANVKEAKANADYIIMHVLNINRGQIRDIKIIKPKHYRQIMDIAKQRVEGKPLQYALGETYFYGCKITLSPHVLIPRFETEILVEKAIQRIGSNKSVLDICTGSGCVAIAIQKNTNCAMTASDISEKAVETAKQNAAINNTEVTFIVSDMFNNICGRKFDVIVGNPPYIAAGDIAKLENQVKDYEPLSALDGGEDGLKYYRIIAEKAKEYLNEGGSVLLEIDPAQADNIKKLFSDYNNIEIYEDLDKNKRIFSAYC